MKPFDILSLLPSSPTFLLLPREVIAIRRARFFGRTLCCHAWRFPYDGAEALPTALAQARMTIRSGHELSHVGLPLEAMTLVHFTLPTGAKADLSSAVRYGLMRHVPFSLDQMRWQYAAKEHDNGIDVTVTLISEAGLADTVDLFSKAGIGVASVFPACTALLGQVAEGGIAALVYDAKQDVLVWNGSRVCWQTRGSHDEVQPMSVAASMLENYGISSRRAVVFGNPAGELPEVLDVVGVLPEEMCLDFSHQFSIDVVSAETLRNVRRFRFAVIVPAFGLLATLALLPFRDVVIWQKRLHDLEDRIESLRTEAGGLAEIKQNNSEIRSRLERWDAHFSQNVPVTSVLRELTRLFPPGAWVESLQIQDHRAILDGNAPSATVLLEQMENSVFFEEVRLDAPVTKQGQVEKFRIVAKISQQ